jgi:hypothetical protein
MEARVEQELALLKTVYPGVVVHRDPSGQHWVELPNFPLPPGWSKAAAAVMFRLPPGYPENRPDCFYADEDLRLANGTMPTNTGQPADRPLGRSWLWFSWHVQRWVPGKDDLCKYAGVIAQRFEKGV